SLKETSYHLRWSAEWVIRLGDGTAESKQRITNALSDQWMFTGEMMESSSFELAATEQGTINGLDSIKEEWNQKLKSVFEEAGLEIPKTTWMQTGGKSGIHTEHLGYLLAEMQHLQRAYPNATW
ncbi:MAG TPA: Phenylacetic acid catabolic protein, partial [Flavisolibacter sp.]